ncbi:hypothetical protein GCM10012285_68160 [Streptomyces kronopolitis]|uniref:Uncharacterized protein n=1 Tax=Streptomyces kronopolitis TaxID=1612435 RepID=A0ABQ2K545_9ACTN|nr:hypothetical protein [Streptomyces kronopolitis]GGN65416.1 hypothetical protein GCM10012285_68160 [Streptomyces kronopolitis]
MTAAYPLAGATGFTNLHGTQVVAIDEDCGTLLMLGHPDDRTVLAVTNAQYRVLYGQRIRPGRALGALTLHGVRRTWARAVPGGGDCPWHTEVTAPDAQHAGPVTLVDVDSLDAEDIAIQEQCPACGRASRTSDIACSPGRTGYSRVHNCHFCGTQWPSADAYRVCLFKVRTRSGGDPSGCFGCGCTATWPCAAGCRLVGGGRPIAQPLCTTCLAQHTPETWQALTAAGYAAAESDEQRDRWLYTEALRGTEPATAAGEWSERRALTRQRALVTHQRDAQPQGLQDEAPEGRADMEGQYADAVRA